MKMVRLSAFASVVVCISVTLLAQNPPQITNSVFDFDTVEDERVSLLVRVSDPDPDESLTLTFSLANGAALGISESQLQFSFKSKTFDASSVNVSNQFSVPSGTLGKTIEIRVDVTDKDSMTASRVFLYRVIGTNQPPVISLSVSQPGSSAAGTQDDPFRFGSLQLTLTIQDDRGVDDYTYGMQIISGTLCVNYPFFWFGREGLTPTVDVPKVATLMALDVSATVVDGIYTETVHRTVWVKPEPEGCASPDPLNSVIATASPNPVFTEGLISLIGSMTGDTAPYAAAWYLASATSADQLIASGWQAQYQAPNFATTLNFKFKVREIAGPGEVVKVVPVIVTTSGGGGGSGPPPPPPPPPNCGCAGGGLPPEVSASADSTTVVGGHKVGLSGIVSDPNYPPGAPGPAPMVFWQLEDTADVNGLDIIGETNTDAQLRTPKVETDQWILLSLNAKNQSNGCECLDYLQLQVLSRGNPGGGGATGPPPADVGTQECREVQFQAQEAVLLGGPYKNNAELVKTASDVVDTYKKNGEISNKCSSCILQEFRRRIPMHEQGACGWLCPCLDLPGWVNLLETEEWTVCDMSDPAWDPLAALKSDSYLLWSGFQVDAPGRPGFDACASMNRIEYEFLDLLFPVSERDRNECMGVILDKAEELGLICE